MWKRRVNSNKKKETGPRERGSMWIFQMSRWKVATSSPPSLFRLLVIVYGVLNGVLVWMLCMDCFLLLDLTYWTYGPVFFSSYFPSRPYFLVSSAVLFVCSSAFVFLPLLSCYVPSLIRFSFSLRPLFILRLLAFIPRLLSLNPSSFSLFFFLRLSSVSSSCLYISSFILLIVLTLSCFILSLAFTRTFPSFPAIYFFPPIPYSPVFPLPIINIFMIDELVRTLPCNNVILICNVFLLFFIMVRTLLQVSCEPAVFLGRCSSRGQTSHSPAFPWLAALCSKSHKPSLIAWLASRKVSWQDSRVQYVFEAPVLIWNSVLDGVRLCSAQVVYIVCWQVFK